MTGLFRGTDYVKSISKAFQSKHEHKPLILHGYDY